MITDRECSGGSGVKRLVFCSGKVYYELAKERKDRELIDQVALVRIEQVSMKAQFKKREKLIFFFFDT